MPLCTTLVLPTSLNYHSYSKTRATHLYFMYFFSPNFAPSQFHCLHSLCQPRCSTQPANMTGTAASLSRLTDGGTNPALWHCCVPQPKHKNCPQCPALSANTTSSAVNKSKANLAYRQLLWKSLWARSAWQRNPSYSYAGNLLHCNCTLYK